MGNENDTLRGGEAEVAYPPRFCWLKRIAMALVVMGICVGGIRLAWGWYAARVVRGEVAALKARGWPYDLASLQPGEVAESTNAVPVLMNAAAGQAAIGIDSPSNSNLDYDAYPPYPDIWHRLTDRSIAANQAALAAIRQARGMETFRWNLVLATPLYSKTLNGAQQIRALSNLVADAALHAHLKGDDRAAFDYIDDMLFLADAIEAQPVMISHLIANGLRSRACETVQIMSPAIRVGEGAGAVDRARIEELIDRLLAESASNEAFARGMSYERVLTFDTIDYVTQGATALRPAYELDKVRASGDANRVIAVGQSENWAEALRLIDTFPSEIDPDSAATYTIFQRSFLGEPKLLRVEFQARLNLRMAATTLAITIYREEHGRWPERLDELVPKYLAEVPRDPFGEGEAAIQLVRVPRGLPNGTVRLLLASVGDDAAGRTSLNRLPSEPQYGAGLRNTAEVRDLTRWHQNDKARVNP